MARVARLLRVSIVACGIGCSFGPLPGWTSTSSREAREDLPHTTTLAPGVFLVASRGLGDSNFKTTVILLIEYTSSGAFGIVINRPSRIDASQVIPDLSTSPERPLPVYLGGPVERRRLLFMIGGDAQRDDMSTVVEGVHVTSKLETFEAALERDERVRVYAGYAGWAPGQLDSEVARDDWHIVTADADAVFDREPEGLWDRLIQLADAIWARLEPAIWARSGERAITGRLDRSALRA